MKSSRGGTVGSPGPRGVQGARLGQVGLDLIPRSQPKENQGKKGKPRRAGKRNVKLTCIESHAIRIRTQIGGNHAPVKVDKLVPRQAELHYLNVAVVRLRCNRPCLSTKCIESFVPYIGCSLQVADTGQMPIICGWPELGHMSQVSDLPGRQVQCPTLFVSRRYLSSRESRRYYGKESFWPSFSPKRAETPPGQKQETVPGWNPRIY